MLNRNYSAAEVRSTAAFVESQSTSRRASANRPELDRAPNTTIDTERPSDSSTSVARQ